MHHLYTTKRGKNAAHQTMMQGEESHKTHAHFRDAKI